MGNFGTCCACRAVVRSTRTWYGSAKLGGFESLYAAQVAARFIVPGWTGVNTNLARGITNTALDFQGWTESAAGPFLVGDSVYIRTSESVYTEWVYTGSFAHHPFLGLGWEPGAGTKKQAYNQVGYWRGGGRTILRGELVYRCIPNALETSDDWSIQPYVCIADIAVTGAIDPRYLPDSFVSLFSSAAGVLGSQTAAIGSRADPVMAGELVTVGGVTYRAVQNFNLGDISDAVMEPYIASRGASDDAPFIYDPAKCVYTSPKRWLSFAAETTLTGPSIDGSGLSSFTVLNPATNPSLEQEFSAMDEVTVPPTSVPPEGGTTYEIFPRCGRFAYPYIPIASAEGPNTAGWHPSTPHIPQVYAWRLTGLSLSPTTQIFTWQILFTLYVKYGVAGPGIGQGVEVLGEGTLKQTVTVGNEHTPEAAIGAMVFSEGTPLIYSAFDTTPGPASPGAARTLGFGGIYSSAYLTAGAWKKQTRVCFSRVTKCVNVTVPSGGMNYFLPLPEMGENVRLSAGSCV